MLQAFNSFERVFLRQIVDNLIQEENTGCAPKVVYVSSFLSIKGVVMAHTNRDMEVGSELSPAEEAELDQFLDDTLIGEALPFARHGSGEEQSMHAGIMHAMENGPQPDIPLTSLIRHGRR